MTDAAVLSIQYLAHGHRRCTCLRFEYFLVAVPAIQPAGMLLVRKHDPRQTAGIIHDDFSVQMLYLGFSADAAARTYITVFEGTHPVHFVACTVGRHSTQGITGVLQPLQGWILRVVQAILLQGFPFTRIHAVETKAHEHEQYTSCQFRRIKHRKFHFELARYINASTAYSANDFFG